MAQGARKTMKPALFVASALIFSLSACSHRCVPPDAMLSLGLAVSPGDIGEMHVIDPSGSSAPFVVPADKVFVLTDVIIAPQQIPTSGFYVFQVTPSAGGTFSTNLNIVSSAEDPSSFQVNLSGGMVFQSGSNVRFHFAAGLATTVPVNVSAFGYLAEP